MTALIALAIGVPLMATDHAAVRVSDGVATVSGVGQRLSVNLGDATLALETPFGRWALEPSIQLGDGWSRPTTAADQPRVVRRGRCVRVSLTFPVAEEREFGLEVAMYEGVPAFFVTSRLRLLTGTRGQYYFWQTNASPTRYAAAEANGMETRDLDTTAWTRIEWADWVFLPGEAGGLAVLPTNVFGRAPGESGGVFLHALPRSTLLGPGDSLDATFGLAGVPDAEAAADLSRAAQARRVPELQPWAAPAERAPIDYGRPAPKWLCEAECYNLYYHPAAEWTEEVVAEKLRRFPLIIGSTPDEEALKRCHRAGIRLLHYVVYTCLLDTERQVREGGVVYSEWQESIDNESRDLKDHPDWVCIDAKGEIQRDAWGQAHGHPGLLNTCLHQEGLHEAARRQVRMLMERGFDGVFIDLAGPTVECYGPRFGKHTHPDRRTNTEAYEDLLRDIYTTVKGYGEERVVAQNTCTGILRGHWPYADMQMLEAFPWGGESTEMLATWPELRSVAGRHGDAVRHGKVPLLLPYFSRFSADEAREPALLSYAYARVNGFLWADGFTLSGIPGNEAFAADLYGLRLERPLSPGRSAGGAAYRAFANGRVFANLTPDEATVRVRVPEGAAFEDLGGEGELTAGEEGGLEVGLAPGEGRVLTTVR